MDAASVKYYLGEPTKVKSSYISTEYLYSELIDTKYGISLKAINPGTVTLKFQHNWNTKVSTLVVKSWTEPSF